MHRLKLATALLSAAALTFAAAACSEQSTAPEPTASADADYVPPAPIEASGASGETAAVPSPSTAPLPVPDPVQSEKGETGARGVLLTWARAIEFGRYPEAYAQYGDGGKRSGLSESAFAAQFAPYKRVTIGFGDGQVEGAAGSLYYEVPVNFTGERKAGGTVRRDGTITLRRVNDVDGATPEQLRWHVDSTTLRF